MFIANFIASFLLLFSLLLHYRQHFRLCSKEQQKLRKRASITESDSSTHRTSWCKCLILTPLDDFDFFPSSFVYYITFKLALCIFIATMEVMTYYYTHNNQLSVDLLFEHPIDKRLSAIFVQQTVSLSNNAPYNISAFSDYILIVSVMILSVWESLFSWYKYYSTSLVVLKCKIISTQEIVMKFTMIYAILFCAIFNIQFFYYRYLWPLILTLYFIFNIYCICKFASILIEKYKLFIENDNRYHKNIQNDTNVLSNVYHMRFISIMCCILQTIYLTLFIIFYNANIVYLLPILWSIASFFDTFNFARNRKCIKHKMYLLTQCCSADIEMKHNIETQINHNNTPSPIKIIIQEDDTKLKNEKQIEIVTMVNTMSSSNSVNELSLSPMTPVSQISIDSLSVPKTNKSLQRPAKQKIIGHHASLSETFSVKNDTPQTPKTPPSPQTPHSPINPMRQSQSYNGQDSHKYGLVRLSSQSTMTRVASDSMAYNEQSYDTNDNKNKLQLPKRAQMQLKHEKNHSEPIVITIEQQQMVESLDIFAKYGFCSRKTINSMFDMDKYCNKLNTMSVQITK